MASSFTGFGAGQSNVAPGSWFRDGTVNVTNGSNMIVGVGTNWKLSPTPPARGDIFTVDGNSLYEIVNIASDLSIQLHKPYAGTTATASSYAIIRNTSATINSRLAAQVTKALNQKQVMIDEQNEWLVSQNPTENFTDALGNVLPVKTPFQMEKDVDEAVGKIGEGVHGVMSETQSNAIRELNKETYAASGFVQAGKHGANPINQGLYTDLTTPNTLLLGGGLSGDSKTKEAVIHINGFVIPVSSLNDAKLCKIILPKSPDGKVTYNSKTGEVINHATVDAAFAAETTDVKVVTKRVDMFGFELYLEEIDNDEIFPYCIQNLSSTFGDTGITTVNSVRPKTYFAVYEGHDCPIGKCVKWSTLTDEQKAKVADYLGASLFVNSKGKLVQLRIRQRTIAGAGNGNWLNVDPNDRSQSNPSLASQGGFINAQGSSSVAPHRSSNWTPYTYFATKTSQDNKSEVGVFSVRSVSSTSYNDECYFMVMGTVPRLNQGAYHPSFNSMGASKVFSSTQEGNYDDWFKGSRLPITSLADCFDFGNYPNTGFAHKVFNSGYIAKAGSGRPDGRFYDAIYADGAGGVIDYRLSSYDMSSVEESGKARERLGNKNYRGVEVNNGVSVSGDFTYTYEETTGGTINLPRKCLSSTIECVHSNDNGATWTKTNPFVSNNTVTVPVGGKSVITFTTFAKQTKPSVNKPIFNGEKGILDVMVTNSHEVSKGVLLNESVTGKIGKGTDYRNYKVLDYVLVDRMFSDYNTSMTALPADASEIACWQVVENGQCTLMFHDGTNYHELAIPYGYAKQKAGAGSSNQAVAVKYRMTPNYYGVSYK
ncbi:hypothetical protein VPAG_00074 [Vibrio phage douglas 12A4]|uniref:hypothetical protein n=1 Tax=Vibrio phage douglas 12A4 TaxID=573171 RepID=UPI0002C0FD48|nr:hypothetical protein VPAG_00074 [Vibrio phage douglas 12A4]AGG58110.1 hypothetical protein VPAG_00074 [Vibrio phage douglas 12A4]